MKIKGKIVNAMLFAAAVGLCTGAFLEVFAAESVREQLKAVVADHLLYGSEGTGFWSCFLSSAKINLPPILAAAAAPYIYITIPLLPVWMFLKSIAIGFSAALTMDAAGLAGMSHIAFKLMPQNMILLPALAVLSAAAAQAGGIRFFQVFSSLPRKRKALHYDARLYFKIVIYGTGAVIISCLMEAFLLQLGF